jgi:hypothetical protein
LSKLLSKSPKNSSFSVYKNDANQIIAGAGSAIIHFTAKNYDVLNEFNTATWTFTPSHSGTYMFFVSSNPFVGGLQTFFQDRIVLNGADILGNQIQTINMAGNIGCISTFLTRLNAGDNVQIRSLNAGVNAYTIINSINTTFKGIRLN